MSNYFINTIIWIAIKSESANLIQANRKQDKCTRKRVYLFDNLGLGLNLNFLNGKFIFYCRKIAFLIVLARKIS